ncbi:MAG: hypothetical protein ACLFM8_00330 [Halobacteriales archaeon]
MSAEVTTSAGARSTRFEVELRRFKRAVLAGALVGVGYLAVVLLDLGVRQPDVVDPTRLAHPLFWLVTVAIAVSSVGTPRDRLAPWAIALGVGYAGALAALSGLLRLGGDAVGVTVVPAVPGWGPLVVVELAGVHLSIVPFQVVGYLGLGYLLARASTNAPRSALGGLLGVATCVGCLASALAAGASALGFAASLGIGTSYTAATIGLIVVAVLLVLVVKRTEAVVPGPQGSNASTA